MSGLLLEHAKVVTMNPQNPIYEDAFLMTDKEKIVYLHTLPPPIVSNDTRRINCSNRLILPGLVNAHTHSPMSLLRGISDDCSLSDWLKLAVWPAESSLTRAEIATGCSLGMAEMLAYGTTSFTDMYRFSETVAKTVATVGIKANLCESITCAADYDPKTHPSTQESMRMVAEWNGYDNGLIRCDTSIQSEFQTIPALWNFIAEFAANQSIGIHIHLSETKEEVENCLKKYGKSAAQLLDESGVFHSRVVASHCIYLKEADLEILANNQTIVVHDPCSNLKMCCGFANLYPIKEKGIPIALGSDGVCSNNSADLFETMKFTALNQKMITGDPCFMSAYDCLYAATMGGLVSQGRELESGILQPGMDADFIALDLSHPGLQPCIRPISNIVYAAKGSHVNLTVVRGKVLFENGVFSTIDLERVLYDVKKIAARFA